MQKVIIVGAGISGLALAYRLQQRLPQVALTILEQRARPGGTMWTERRDGFQVELGPNGFLDSKPSTMRLCRELGLEAELRPASEAASRNRYLFLDGRLRRLPNSLMTFLTSDLLSWRGKVSIIRERFRPGRSPGSEETVDAFVRRRVGDEVAEVLADAFVTGIHAGDPTLLSMRAAFPRLVACEEQYGSVLKGLMVLARQRRAKAAARGEPAGTGKMWSFADGLRVLVETLSARLAKPPLLGVAARRLQRRAEVTPPDGAWSVCGDGQDSWSADAVVLTCPAPAQAGLLAEVDAELAQQIGAIAYNRVAVVALGYRRGDVPIDLDGFGFILPQRTRQDALGVQWCSSIFPQRAPADQVLLRALCGGWNRPDVIDWDDQRLLQAVRHILQQAMGIEAAPVFQEVVRWERAIPQYHVGHPGRVAWIEARVAQYPGLFVGGNAYHGVAVNDCTEQAEMLATQVEHYLTRPK